MPLIFTFSSPISAFGFYGTDVGDTGGQLMLHLSGGGTVSMNIPHTINGKDGSLLFFGFIDPTQSYTSITFSNGGFGLDFGFDDMVIAERAQIIVSVPEPASAALLAMALLGMGAATRRQRRA